MPTLPWTTTATGKTSQGEVVVLASRLDLRNLRHTARFLRAALRIRKQVLASPGAQGVSLVAQPASRTYWTLSTWSDQGSLDTFVRTDPHRGYMRSLRPLVSGAHFVSWTMPAGVPTWDDARSRLSAQDRSDG